MHSLRRGIAQGEPLPKLEEPPDHVFEEIPHLRAGEPLGVETSRGLRGTKELRVYLQMLPGLRTENLRAAETDVVFDRERENPAVTVVPPAHPGGQSFEAPISAGCADRHDAICRLNLDHEGPPGSTSRPRGHANVHGNLINSSIARPLPFVPAMGPRGNVQSLRLH